jgi:hypothetical protein
MHVAKAVFLAMPIRRQQSTDGKPMTKLAGRNDSIKYRYAMHPDGSVADAYGLERKNLKPGEKFVCIACERELIPHLGKIRRKHFVHKAKLSCSPETYLHRLAKMLLYTEYQQCLDKGTPFILERTIEMVCYSHIGLLGQVCKLPLELIHEDLTHTYPVVRLESGSDGFVPDLLLESSDGLQKLFFEIAVTHRASKEKIQAGRPIIEVVVASEEDLDFCNLHLVSENWAKVTLWNFPLHIEVEECSCTYEDLERLARVPTKPPVLYIGNDPQVQELFEGRTLSIHAIIQNMCCCLTHDEYISPWLPITDFTAAVSPW